MGFAVRGVGGRDGLASTHADQPRGLAHLGVSATQLTGVVQEKAPAQCQAAARMVQPGAKFLDDLRVAHTGE